MSHVFSPIFCPFASVMTDFLAKSMANLKNNKTLHFASVTWQNEPFDDN